MIERKRPPHFYIPKGAFPSASSMTTSPSSPPELPRPRSTSLRWLALLICPFLGLLAGLLVAVVLLYFLPKDYESRAVLQVHSEPTSVARPLVTEDLVDEVARNLDLAKIWNTSESDAVARLREKIAAERLRGTDLVEMRVRSTDAGEAREIAAAVVDRVVQTRSEEEAARSEDELEAINAEVRSMEAEFEPIRAAWLEAEPSWAAKRLAQAETELRRLDVQLETMESLKGEELRKYAAGLADANDGAVSLFFRELASERKSLLLLQDSGLGESHPSIVTAQQRILETENDLDNAILTLRAEMGKERERLGVRIEERRPAQKGIGRPAMRAQYESAREALQLLLLKASSKRIAVRIPRQPVTVHEMPKVPKQPVAPRAALTLALGSGVGLLLGFLVALPIALEGRKRK